MEKKLQKERLLCKRKYSLYIIITLCNIIYINDILGGLLKIEFWGVWVQEVVGLGLIFDAAKLRFFFLETNLNAFTDV